MKHFLKKTLCLILCLGQVFTPNLLWASQGTEEDLNVLIRGKFYQARSRGVNTEALPKTVDCQEVRPDSHGVFRLAFDPSLYQETAFLYLTQEANLVAVVSIADEILKLVGNEDKNFQVESLQERGDGNTSPALLKKFYAQTKGNLAVKGNSIAEFAWFQGAKLSLEGEQTYSKGLEIPESETCTLKGTFSSPKTQLKTKRFSHQGILKGADVLLEFEEGEDTQASDIQADYDIIFKGFKSYQHHGLFRAKRSVIYEGEAFQNMPGSRTFAGLVQYFKGAKYQDAGHTVAWQSYIDAAQSSFKDTYNFKGHFLLANAGDFFSAIEVMKGASINAAFAVQMQSMNRLLHKGSIAIQPSLLDLPIWEYAFGPIASGDLTQRLHEEAFLASYKQLKQDIAAYRREYKKDFKPLSGILLDAKGSLTVDGANLDTKSSSVTYRAGKLYFKGSSQSGFAQNNLTLIQATQAICAGILRAPILARFEVEKELSIPGIVKSPITEIVSSQVSIPGQIDGGLAIAGADRVSLSGQFRGPFLNIYAQLTELAESAQVKMSELIFIKSETARLNGDLATKDLVVNAPTTDIASSTHIEVSKQATFKAQAHFDNQGTVHSQGDLSLRVGEEYNLGDFKADKRTTLEADRYQEDVVSILAGDHPQYTRSGELHIITQEPVISDRAIDVPHGIGVTAPEIILSDPVRSEGDVDLRTTENSLALYGPLACQNVSLESAAHILTTDVTHSQNGCFRARGDYSIYGTVDGSHGVTEVDAYSLTLALSSSRLIAKVLLNRIQEDVLNYGLVHGLSLSELHCYNYRGILGAFKAGHAWLDVRNQYTTTGTTVIDGLLVMDILHTLIQREQTRWQETYTTVMTKKRKWGKNKQHVEYHTIQRAEAYPLEVSGLFSADTLVTGYSQDVSTLFPDRPRSGTPVGQTFVVQGGEIRLGAGGMDLRIAQLIQATPLVDVGATQYAMRNKKYKETGVIPQYSIIQPKFISQRGGSIRMETDHVAFQAVLVAAYGQGADISIIGRRHIDFPDIKVWQDIVPYLQKVKGITYRIIGQHEIGAVNIFIAPTGRVTVRCERGSVTGVEPLIESTNNGHVFEAETVQLSQQSFEERYEVQIVSRGDQKTLQRLATLVSLGVSLMTGGAASPLAGLVGEGLFGTMLTAGFSGLCSQAASAALVNEGKLKRAFKDLGSKQFLRSLGITMASAGLMRELGGRLQLPSRPTTFEGFVHYNALRSGVAIGLNTTLGGQDVRHALEQGGLSFAANVLQSWAAYQTGQRYRTGQIGYAGHKLEHFLEGLGAAAIVSKGNVRAMLIGGGAAALSEMFAESLLPNPARLPEQLQRESIRREGRLLLGQDLQDAVQGRIESIADMARMLTATTVFLAGQDIDLAMRTADNALDNNWVQAALIVASGAATVYALYDIYDTYETEGAEAALMKAGVEAGAAVIGTTVVKKAFQVGGKVYLTAEAAWAAYAETSPFLMKMVEKTSGVVGKAKPLAHAVSSKVRGLKSAADNSALGRAVARMEAGFGDLCGSLDAGVGRLLGRAVPRPMTHGEMYFTLEALDVEIYSGFKGRKGFELKNISFQKTRNALDIINGRLFSGHALDQMQNRGIMPSVVENTIKKGKPFPTGAGTIGYYEGENNIRVILDSRSGKIITVIFGKSNK